MATQRLNQVLAVEAGMKSRIEDELTKVYHTLQKSALFEGMVRSYRPVNETGEKLPTETRKVQQNAEGLLKETLSRLGEIFDVTAAKDFANCNAKADVVVDGEVLIAQAPATYLLFLQSYLVHVHTVINKLPVLDPAESWTIDPVDAVFKTSKVEKARHLKVDKVITKFLPTPEHPGQAEVVKEDVLVGYYEESKQSAAFPPAEQKRLLARVEALQAAVKRAREAANLVEAPEQSVATKLFGWVFKK